MEYVIGIVVVLIVWKLITVLRMNPENADDQYKLQIARLKVELPNDKKHLLNSPDFLETIREEAEFLAKKAKSKKRWKEMEDMFK